MNKSNTRQIRILYILVFSNLIFIFKGISQPTLSSLMDLKAKTTNDSIKANAYYDLSRLTSSENAELALKYADTGKIIFDKIKNDSGKNLYQYIKSIIFYSSGHYEESIEAGEKYLQWTVDTKNREREWYAVSNLSKLYRETGDLTKGIEQSLKGIEIGLELNRDDENGYFYNELGNMYATLKQYETSNLYFQKALDLSKKLSYIPGQSVSLRNISTNHLSLNRPEVALEIANQSLAIDSAQNNNLGIGRSLQLIARIHHHQNKFEEAIAYYLKALKSIEKENNANDQVSVLQGLTKNYLAINNPIKANEFFTKIKKWTSSIEASDLSLEQSNLEAELLEKQGKHSDALQSYKSYMNKNTKEFSRDIANQITGLHIQFESKRKEDQITLLTNEKIITNLKLRTARIQMIAALLGLLCFSILGYYIFTLLQTSKKQKNLIAKSLSEKETLLREIHHRVKNNLQVISSLLNLQARNVEDASTLAVLKEGQNRVKSMALIHQNLYQDQNLTGIEIDKYFEALINNLFNSYNVSKDRIRLLTSIDPIHLDVDTMIPLGLVINELISNSLKYAFPENKAGTISVRVKEDNNTLKIIVEDDGIGIADLQKQSSTKSFGYRMIHAFAQQLNADIDVDNTSGTTVTLLLKEYRKAS